MILALPLVACRAARGPEDIAERYARALEAAKLEDAYVLTSAGFQARTSRDQFRQQFASEQDRRDRAAEVRAAVSGLTARAPGVELSREGEDWRIDERSREPRTPATDAAATLRRFLDAVERGDFDAAYALLSGPLRARYTPESFERDFRVEPLASERVSRARAALASTPVAVTGGFAFPVGGDKAVRLVREPGGYRVTAIE